MRKVTTKAYGKMTLGEIIALYKKHVPVTESVYLKLSLNYNERKRREELVKRYGYYKNVRFYSDGSILKTGPGVIGELGTPRIH